TLNLADASSYTFLGDRFHGGALAAGGSYHVPATFTLPDGLNGTYYAFVITDRAHTVFEDGTYDNNTNHADAATAVASRPADLVGQYYFFVVADADHNVYEGLNEGNNASPALPLTVTRQTPDLQVTVVTVPATAVAGSPLSVQWTVKNLGTNLTNSNYSYD